MDVVGLKPGEYVWHPDLQPFGPVAIVVSLVQQRAHLYRNGVRIAVSTCSSGKKGHETPTGVFVVLQKDKNHRSSTYNNAPMPNMNRLTWDGIALHAGDLPGYPASHGCVRLPKSFSEKLFTVTHVGTPVIIAGSEDSPSLVYPGPILSGYAHREMAQAIASSDSNLRPADWVETESNEFTTIIVSAAESRAVVLVNNQEVDAGRVVVTGRAPIGQHVFVLGSVSQQTKLIWRGISHHNVSGLPMQSDPELFGRMVFEKKFAKRVARRIPSGSILILTETPILPTDRSGDDFVILNTES